jgi:GT2 family glycosyltransferase
MATSTLRVSIVVFRPDIEWLDRTMASLVRSCRVAVRSGAISRLQIDVIDNGTTGEGALDACIGRLIQALPTAQVRTLRGHGNVGYGAGHNLSIMAGDDDVHLVLNPDVELDEMCVAHATRYLDEHPGVALLAPDVKGADGQRQFLCRRPPSVLVLFLRGFAPAAIARRFRPYLDRYEMRDVVGRGVEADVPLVSGCCMFARGRAVRAIGGFSPLFFLYFEDYDLSLRLSREGLVRYVPAVLITHGGGFTARRGWSHVRLFLASAAKYFSAHGWKWI